MYVRLELGEFIVPAREDWPPFVRYRAEPPVVVRGAMNPWQLERQRVLWMAEEAAWKKIQAYQVTYRQVESRLKSSIDEFNRLLVEFENFVGKKTGIDQIAKYGAFAGVIPGFQLLGGIFAAISFLSTLIGGASKKKKAERMAKRLEALQASMVADQQSLQVLSDQIAGQVSVSQQVKQAQQEIKAAVIEQSQVAYQTRQGNEAQRAATHEALNLMAARLYPSSRQGVSNGL